MKSHPSNFLLFLCLAPAILFAQVNISGRVLNDDTGQPLGNTSVYINNSTIGTTTNEKGEFSLHGIGPGTYEIVVSHLGFETIVHRVVAGSQELRFAMRLTPKVEEMHEILVVSSAQRKRWLRIMMDYFLGLTIAASRSRILNESDIAFERTGSRNIIKAYSLQPLVVENRELGYRIYFDLKEFFYDDSLGSTRFYGYTRFEELKDSKHQLSQRYIKMREGTYRGSTLHFYQSLLDNSLPYEGFSLFIRPPQDSAGMMGAGKDAGGASGAGSAPAKIRLSFPVTGNEILFTDSLSGKKYLKWDGTLIVRYAHDPYYKQSLRSQVFIEGSLPKGFQSYVHLLGSPVFLDENGVVLNPLLIEYGGFWSYEKLANMLPINYRPGKPGIKN